LLYEDDETNRMMESLDLFDQYINQEIFRELPIFLVLNKIDLFKKKIMDYNISDLFEDFDKEYNHDFDYCLKVKKKNIYIKKFVENKFLERNKYNPKRIHIFYLTTHNDEEFRNVFSKIISNFS
jgi:GTPase SAR1 family protein